MKASSQTIRHLYFLVASVVTLAMIISSLGYLIYIGIESVVLSGNDALIKRESPPMLFLDSGISEKTAAPVVAPIEITACEGQECTLTPQNKESVNAWFTSYQQWKDQKVGIARSRGIASALSFLIVSTPIFFIHYRIFKKIVLQDIEENKVIGAVSSTYFYIVSLGTLIVSIVFGAMMLNTILRTWVVPDGNSSPNTPIIATSSTDIASVQAILSCKDQCGFSDEQMALARQWKDDNDAYQKASQNYYGSWKLELSGSFAAIIVTLPVLFYHWKRIKSYRNKTSPKEPSTTVGA